MKNVGQDRQNRKSDGGAVSLYQGGRLSIMRDGRNYILSQGGRSSFFAFPGGLSDLLARVMEAQAMREISGKGLFDIPAEEFKRIHDHAVSEVRSIARQIGLRERGDSQ